MILLADSGSTKTSWTTLEEGRMGQVWQTEGINPVRDSGETIDRVLESLVLEEQTGEEKTKKEQTEELQTGAKQTDLTRRGGIEQVYFYGAGCIDPFARRVRSALERRFPGAQIRVESDMLGAAIALCGHREGIACILGTGANSCLFDGRRIVAQTPALGYILGDEGSGAALGKRLVGDVFKRQLPEDILRAFGEETGLTCADVIQRVYREPLPNKFLASLVPFLHRHLDCREVEELVVEEFERFVHRNLRNYHRCDLPVHFVGGITRSFPTQLERAVRAQGFQMGRTLQMPIQEMARYHIEGSTTTRM